MPGAMIVIGDEVSLNGTSITCCNHVSIGNRTMIAANVIIMDSDFHHHWPPSNRRSDPIPDDAAPVRIGDGVWIGVGATILKGTTIGENSIIGAGSVVTGVIPPNVVAAGVPARIIRNLGP
jgi:acetyltransferase-like isoleucine patch superfamily enzyme